MHCRTHIHKAGFVDPLVLEMMFEEFLPYMGMASFLSCDLNHSQFTLSNLMDTPYERGSSILYGIYIGFCPRTEFNKTL